MQEGTTSRADFFFRRAARHNRRRTSLTVLRMPRSFAVISRSQGSHFALPRLSMNFALAGMPPQFRTSPSIRSLQVPSTPRFSIPLLSAFYPLQRLPVLLSSCTNSCKLLQLLRKALPSLFLRTSLLGGNTIRLVSWNYATRDAGRTIMPTQVPGASIPDESRQSRRPQSAVALR